MKPTKRNEPPATQRGGWSGGPIQDERSRWPLVAFLIGLAAVGIYTYLTLA